MSDPPDSSDPAKTPDPPPKPTPQTPREQRLAKALRDNLRRRKTTE
jgi:hypothetical protein